MKIQLISNSSKVLKLAVWRSIIVEVDGSYPLESTKTWCYFFLEAFRSLSDPHQVAEELILLLYTLVPSLNLIKLLSKMAYIASKILLRKLRLTLNLHTREINSLQNIIIMKIDLPLV